jgi:hypothetical protein
LAVAECASTLGVPVSRTSKIRAERQVHIFGEHRTVTLPLKMILYLIETFANYKVMAILPGFYMVTWLPSVSLIAVWAVAVAIWRQFPPGQ